MSDATSSNDRSRSGGGGTVPLRPLAVAAATAVAVTAGQKLLHRRHRGAERDSGLGGRGKRAEAMTRQPEADEPADLATELRAAANDLALALLDRATNRLERAKN